MFSSDLLLLQLRIPVRHYKKFGDVGGPKKFANIVHCMRLCMTGQNTTIVKEVKPIVVFFNLH